MNTFEYNDDDDDIDPCFNSQDTLGTICDLICGTHITSVPSEQITQEIPSASVEQILKEKEVVDLIATTIKLKLQESKEALAELKKIAAEVELATDDIQVIIEKKRLFWTLLLQE